jgi:predicted ATPase
LVVLSRHALAHLPTAIQQALAFASIEGDEFRICVLAEALAGSTPEVARELAELARGDGWLLHVGREAFPDGVLTERYRFAHVLYQNVLYGGLSSQRRVSLHRRTALTLEAHGCARLRRFLAELAWHQEHGRRFARAVMTLTSAGDHAARMGAPREALSYHARARTLLSKLPDGEQPSGSPLLLQR